MDKSDKILRCCIAVLVVIVLLLIGVRASFAQLTIPPITAECATSVDGSVVGTPNPLNPPVVSTVFSGTLPAGNYYIEEAWYDAASNTTLVSPEVQIQLSGTGELQESPPTSGLAATVVGRNIYIGTTSGGETLQGTVVGSATYTQSVPLVSGAAVPSLNTTQCLIIANDAGWPTGTGYQWSVTTPAGQTLPGSPQQIQLLGPGNTINISQGLPLYNGTVTYPIPILARPYGHGPQSISGPLSMTNYNLVNVGKLGVGTGLPAWGVDAEGSGINGAINANTGFLFNGTAPNGHALVGSGAYFMPYALPQPLTGTLNVDVTTPPATIGTINIVSSIEANQTFAFDCSILYEVSNTAATPAISTSDTGGGSSTTGRCFGRQYTDNAGTSASGSETGGFLCPSLNSAVNAANTVYEAHFHGSTETGGGAHTLTLQFGGVLGGSVTINEGTSCTVTPSAFAF